MIRTSPGPDSGRIERRQIEIGFGFIGHGVPGLL